MKNLFITIILLPNLVFGQIKILKNNLNASSYIKYNNELYFWASGVEGTGLWKTDGTTIGTIFIKTLNNSIEISGVKQPVISGNLLYFNVGGDLWRTNGTESGTINISNGFINALNKIDLNGIMIFVANDANGYELWRSDGTVEGTNKIIDFYSGSSSGVNLFNMAKQGNYVYFVGNTELLTSVLCKTDGTASGTSVVSNSGKVNSDLAEVNGNIVFQARFEYDVICNGMPASTDYVYKIMKIENGNSVLLMNPAEWFSGTYPLNYCRYLASFFNNTQYFRKVGNNLFFKGMYFIDANNTTLGLTEALWSTDGNTTQLVKIFPGGNPNHYIIEPTFWDLSNSNDNTFMNDIFYFPAGVNNDSDFEVWRTNRTDVGTFQLKDIYPGSNSSNPKDFRTINGITYFTAFNGTNNKIYRTDGSILNTFEVFDADFLLLNAKSSALYTMGNTNQFSNTIANKLIFSGLTTQNTNAIFSVEQCVTNNSINSGSWSSIATWSCGHVPLSTETIEIAPGHVVNLNGNAEAKSINLLGTLNLNNFELKLRGNFP